MVRFGSHSPELLKFLGAEVLDTAHSDNLFAEIEPIDIPEDAVDIGNGRYIAIRKNNRDKGQRIACGCMKSKDIGEYNTCPHLCEYCYANASKELAIANWKCHKENPWGETITGR